jgi:hypothetical protein
VVEGGGGVGGKGGGGGRGEKWTKPCMHIWIVKEKKRNRGIKGREQLDFFFKSPDPEVGLDVSLFFNVLILSYTFFWYLL